MFLNGNRLPDGSVFLKGTSGVWTDTSKMCCMVMNEGGKCNRDPFWVCGDSLNCDNNICEQEKMPLNGDCLANGLLSVEGTSCVSNVKHKM